MFGVIGKHDTRDRASRARRHRRGQALEEAIPARAPGFPALLRLAGRALERLVLRLPAADRLHLVLGAARARHSTDVEDREVRERGPPLALPFAREVVAHRLLQVLARLPAL